MTTPIQSMRKTLKDYLTEVEAILAELSELENLCETFNTILRGNGEIHANIESSTLKIAELQVQRDELYAEYFNASFEGLTEQVESIGYQRETIDNTISQLEETITESRKKLVQLDASAVSHMLSRYWSIELPVFTSDYILGYVKDASRSGLVEQLQQGDKELRDQIASAKTRIMATNWTQYADEDVLRDIAPKVADQLFGTLASKATYKRLEETLAGAKRG